MRAAAGEFEPRGFVGTATGADPLDGPRWFVRRGSSVEVTVAAVRRHPGVDTQGRGSDPAVGRTTPALLGRRSPVALWAGAALGNGGVAARRAAWSPKPPPTFSAGLAAVRHRLCSSPTFVASPQCADVAEVPRAPLHGLTPAACSPASMAQVGLMIRDNLTPEELRRYGRREGNRRAALPMLALANALQA